jgi:hypothetical protein
LDPVGGEKTDDNPALIMTFVICTSAVSLLIPIDSLYLRSLGPSSFASHPYGEMRGIEDSRYIFRVRLFCYRGFVVDGFSRQRWNSLLDGRDTPSDLRKALKSEQEYNICNDGLRSICWKAHILSYALGFYAYLDLGISTI